MTEMEEENTCSVCLDEFKHKTGVFFVNLKKTRYVCNHEFCQECIVNWRRANGDTCPLCRRSLIYVEDNSVEEEDTTEISMEEMSVDLEDIYVDEIIN